MIVGRQSRSRRIFLVCNYIFLAALALLCILPLVHVLAVSFSSSWAAAAGMVKLWPVAATLRSYAFVLAKPQLVASLIVSLKRVALGVGVSMALTITSAFVLSREKRELRARNFYSWFFIVTILFSGGLIPFYITIRTLGMLDTIWALVLPPAVPVFNVLLLMNFYRQLPKEIEESCFMDGAGYWTTLWRMHVPLSMPAIATLILFTTVGHWNSWFDGLILMNRESNYPLQSYLQTVIMALADTKITQYLSTKDLAILNEISDRTTKAAQVFIATAPILALYPFLQRYFMSGIVLGSVKG